LHSWFTQELHSIKHKIFRDKVKCKISVVFALCPAGPELIDFYCLGFADLLCLNKLCTFNPNISSFVLENFDFRKIGLIFLRIFVVRRLLFWGNGILF